MTIRDKDPSVGTAIEALKEEPQFAKLEDKHWRAIEAMWDLAEGGRRPSFKQIADEVDMSEQTVRRWRQRGDFLEASERFSRLVLFDWSPALAHKALKDALAGDKKLLLFFLERIYPKPEDGGGTEGVSVVFESWENQPTQVIDVEAKSEDEECP